jgi:general secretion pathway protein J
MMFALNKKAAAGFTLIEVLLAISIFAMISLASFSIFDGVLKSDEYSQQHMKRLTEVQRAWILIERDFLQIAQRSMRVDGEEPLEGFIHTDVDALQSSDQAIAFVRNGWTNPGLLIPRSDVQSVAYRLYDNQLQRLHYNFVDAIVGEEPKIRPLINGVTALKFEYFYKKKWQKQLDDKNSPLAIKVIIETEDLGEIHRQFLVTVDDTTKAKATTP